jgi:hypothetical protein
VEQRIGSSSQPLEGAGFDPAFIPGLTSPGPQKAEDAGPRETQAAPEEAVEDADEPTTASAESEEPEEPAGPDEEEAPDGPVFEASDRRAKIVADHRGVRLSLDDQACEFRWDEIGAIETETPRFGKRFTITVHTPDRRWYPIEIEAESRARFAEWDERLDAVMDRYFEDETPETPETPETTEESEESD